MKSYIDILNETYKQVEKEVSNLAKEITANFKKNFNTKLLIDRNEKENKLNALGVIVVTITATEIFKALCKEGNSEKGNNMQ